MEVLVMGWLKSVFGAVVLAGTFYVGYKWGEADTHEKYDVKLPYAVEVHNGNYMLVKTESEEAQPITPTLPYAGLHNAHVMGRPSESTA